MRRLFLCGAAVAAILVSTDGATFAADLARSRYVAPLPAAPIYNWSGLYIGGHIGFGSAKFEFHTGVNSGTPTSIVGGAQLGYNWQAGSVVWGVESDVSAAGFEAGQADPIGAKVDLLASLRGRLGIAFDQVLVYGTAGLGYVHGKAEAQTLGTILSTTFGNTRGVVGAGIAWAQSNNMTIQVEALDYLGSTSFGLGGDVGNNIGDVWVARLGVNFRL